MRILFLVIGLMLVAVQAQAQRAPDTSGIGYRPQLGRNLPLDAAFTDHLFSLGYEVRPLIGDDYRDFIVKDLEKWRAVARAGDIKIEN